MRQQTSCIAQVQLLHSAIRVASLAFFYFAVLSFRCPPIKIPSMLVVIRIRGSWFVMGLMLLSVVYNRVSTMHHAASLAGSSPLDVLTGHHLRFPNKPRMTQTFSTGASELENMNSQRVIVVIQIFPE